jgi:hypothetical protein
MANSQTAFLIHSQVPNRQALHEAIKNLRFKLSIDDTYVPHACAGYIPCTLDGEDAGIDIKFGAAAAQLDDAPQLQTQIGERDTAITLRWGGDLRERISVMIIAAVLANDFGALIQHQSEDGFRATEQLIDEARKAFAQLQEQ